MYQNGKGQIIASVNKELKHKRFEHQKDKFSDIEEDIGRRNKRIYFTLQTYQKTN